MLNRRQFITTTASAGAAAALHPNGAEAAYRIPPEHMPKLVSISRDIPVGEIHVDPIRFYLYWTLPKAKAIRYAVGVGKKGLYQSGEFTVGRKAEWPSWRPTPSMIKRNPGYAKFAGGMPGGPKNPLGARALYLYNDRGYDTALRIHGTPQPWTLMQAVSNGCARLANSHVIHLYEQVPEGTRVVLHPDS